MKFQLMINYVRSHRIVAFLSLILCLIAAYLWFNMPDSGQVAAKNQVAKRDIDQTHRLEEKRALLQSEISAEQAELARLAKERAMFDAELIRLQQQLDGTEDKLREREAKVNALKAAKEQQ